MYVSVSITNLGKLRSALHACEWSLFGVEAKVVIELVQVGKDGESAAWRVTLVDLRLIV